MLHKMLGHRIRRVTWKQLNDKMNANKVRKITYQIMRIDISNEAIKCEKPFSNAVRYENANWKMPSC